MLAYLGVFGAGPGFSAVIAMALAFVAAPLIAWTTQGRYYIARSSVEPDLAGLPDAGAYMGGARRLRHCVICERRYEGDDMATCPAYRRPDLLAVLFPGRTLPRPVQARRRRAHQAQVATPCCVGLTPRAWWPQLDTGLGRYLLLMAVVAPALAALMLHAVPGHELHQLGWRPPPTADAGAAPRC